MSTISEYQKKRYHDRKENHQCVRCGGTDERTLRGAVCCGACVEKRKDVRKRYLSTEKGKSKRRQYTLNRYYKRKNAGLCTVCGQVPSEEGSTRCAKCIERDKINAKLGSRKRRREIYNASKKNG